MFGIDDAFGLLMEFSAHLGWFIVVLPTMFLYLYKRHIVNIFFHLGAMGLTYLYWFSGAHFSNDFVWDYPLIIFSFVFTSFGFWQIIPHLLFCIYATILNYEYFKLLNIKDKFSLCVKSLFAGLTLAIIWICIILLLTFYFDDGAISNKLVTLEIALAILTNISLLAYIIYKDIKAYLAKKKER